MLNIEQTVLIMLTLTTKDSFLRRTRALFKSSAWVLVVVHQIFLWMTDYKHVLILHEQLVMFIYNDERLPWNIRFLLSYLSLLTIILMKYTNVYTSVFNCFSTRSYYYWHWFSDRVKALEKEIYFHTVILLFCFNFPFEMVCGNFETL